MRRYATAAALLGLLLSAGPVGAQGFGFGLHAGPSPVIGDYGSESGVNAGGADLGYSIGLDLWLPMERIRPRLSWYSSAGIVRHSVDEVIGRAGTFVEGEYLFAPVMTGLRYDFGDAAPRAFVTGQAGVVLTRGPSRTYPLGFGESDPELGTSFGFNVGAGAQLTDRFMVGAKYYPLDRIEFEYEGDDPLEQKVSFLELYVGVGIR